MDIKKMEKVGALQNEIKIRSLNEWNQLQTDFLSMPIGSSKVYAAVKAFAEDVNGSEYLADGLESGMVVNGIPHEEAQCSSFENQIFDIVVPSYVFEHVNDYQSCLAEVAHILKPQGKMYLAILL